jgi:hypothetical protein
MALRTSLRFDHVGSIGYINTEIHGNTTDSSLRFYLYSSSSCINSISRKNFTHFTDLPLIAVSPDACSTSAFVFSTCYSQASMSAKLFVIKTLRFQSINHKDCR